MLLYIIVRFFYNCQTLLRSFWLLTTSQINTRIKKIQWYYLEKLNSQLLEPSKLIKKHIELGSSDNDEEISMSSPYSQKLTIKSKAMKDSFTGARESKQKFEANIAKNYKKVISETPNRSLFSIKLLNLIIRFSWKSCLILCIYIIWRSISRITLNNSSEILSFYKTFMKMTTSTINVNTLSFQHFSEYSNITFVDPEYIRNRDISISNFYDFIQKIRGSNIASFISSINNNVESLTINPGLFPPFDFNPIRSKNLSFSYLRNPFEVGQSFRNDMNKTLIEELALSIKHITSVGFKTSFLTHINLNDFLIVYYKKIKNYEENYKHIEKDLHLLLLNLSNTFALVSEEIDLAFDNHFTMMFVREILFILAYFCLCVYFLFSQHKLYSKEVPETIYHCRNIVNLFSLDEFAENKILEQYFIEELQTSLKD